MTRLGVLAVPIALALVAAAARAQEPGGDARVRDEEVCGEGAASLRIVAPDRRLVLAFERARSELEAGLACGDGEAEADGGEAAAMRKALPLGGSVTALAHYRDHRAWEGEALLRGVVEGEGALGVPDAADFVEAMVRGVLGLEVDVPYRAVEVAPHLPAAWDTVAIEGVRVGPAALAVLIHRGDGSFSMRLRRVDGGSTPIMTRVAPALPLGARVERVMVDDHDVPLHAEASPHDVHPIVEWWLIGEAQVEIEYRGGVEVVAPAPDAGIRVVDFREEEGEYVLLLEGRAGTEHVVELRAGEGIGRLRGAWADEVEGDRIRIRVRFPGTGPGDGRREVRFATERRVDEGPVAAVPR